MNQHHNTQQEPAVLLFVENDKMICHTIRENLTSTGLKVVEASDGQAALSLFKNNPPDLVLLGTLMPGIDSYQTCAAIRHLSNETETPVIMLTESADNETVNLAYESGATDFVSKPINPTVLNHRIQYCLQSKRITTSLRENRNHFHELSDNITGLFWIINLEGSEFIYLSPAYEEIWGRPREELYDKAMLWTEAIHANDRKRVNSEFSKALSTGYFDHEYRIVRPDGTVRWIHDRGFPVLDDNGNIYRIAGIAEDISDRKSLESQLFQAQKLESIGQLAAGIAHEINTPTQFVGDNTHFLQNAFNDLIAMENNYALLLDAAKKKASAPN